MTQLRTLCFFFLFLGSQLWAESFDHTHAAFTEVLREHVVDGLVDYKALKKDPVALNGYLATLATVSRSDFKTWNEDQQVAFLVNLYNAATLDMILQYYPVKRIKDIGNILKGPWKQEVVSLWGDTTTLGHVEHKILRVDYPEVPEIHFALVYAAIGCPILQSEAYDAGRLEEQFAAARTAFLSDNAKNRVDSTKRRIYLSPIFKWFAKDFKHTEGSVQAYVQKHAWPEVTEDYKITYTHYDWSLNEQ